MERKSVESSSALPRSTARRCRSNSVSGGGPISWSGKRTAS